MLLQILLFAPRLLEVPFYGSLVQNLRGFFVPYRLVFPQWHAFHEDVIGTNYGANSLVSKPPVFNSIVLTEMFFTYSATAQYLSTAVTVNDPYDFIIDGTDYYQLTVLGRRFLYVLESLGYKIITSTTKDNEEYNALALLCYAKVFIDWYANSQYLNSGGVLLTEQLFCFNNPASNLYLTEDDIFRILTLCTNNVYDTDDYYVNAWDNPVSPNNGQFTGFTFADPTSNSGVYVGTNSLGSPEMIKSSGAEIGTTYIHEALKKLTDYQKRHALAGARSIDRVLAQYGIVTDSLKQSRSIYIGSQQVAIETGSVMATASATNVDGSTSNVGDYSGAGFGKGSKNWDFQADEEGMFIIIATINPVGSMVQGYDRFNTLTDKLSFFQPEFDSLGVSAIEKGEVYVSDGGMLNELLSPSGYKGVFGYSGRYGFLKRPKNFLTGDLRLDKNFYHGASAWHLFRMFGPNNFLNSSNTPDVQEISHSLDFTRSTDAAQYNRVFQYTIGDRDPFYCFIHFDMVSYCPCKPLFETYEFDSNGKTVTTENGNKVN